MAAALSTLGTLPRAAAPLTYDLSRPSFGPMRVSATPDNSEASFRTS
uniref:Uncharacterized protein n=1 Tax=Myoviridae sp. ctPkm1 TaxID=2825099 RepID=A0A8S5TYG7_9CAUD|nr:MAG TPA: hypothetical protein [Myoviridae sp. ctPkm1]